MMILLRVPSPQCNQSTNTLNEKNEGAKMNIVKIRLPVTKIHD